MNTTGMNNISYEYEYLMDEQWFMRIVPGV